MEVTETATIPIKGREPPKPTGFIMRLGSTAWGDRDGDILDRDHPGAFDVADAAATDAGFCGRGHSLSLLLL